MSRLLAALRFRPVAATLAVLVLFLAYEAWLTLSGWQKLTEDELPAGGGRAPYEVTLRFAPEAFHITRLQQAGRLIEVKGSGVFLMDVPEEAIRAIARNYWVADIRPWQGL